MDFIRWIVLKKLDYFFQSGTYIPVFMLNVLFLILVSAVVAAAAGPAFQVFCILTAISLVGWSIPVYVYAEVAWKKLRAEFRRK